MREMVMRIALTWPHQQPTAYRPGVFSCRPRPTASRAHQRISVQGPRERPVQWRQPRDGIST